MAKQKKPFARRDEQPKFTIERLEQLADDLKSGRIPLGRVTVGDDMVISLRATIRKTGAIAYHVIYKPGDTSDGDSPVWMKVGAHPEISIKQARARAVTIQALGEKGIDVRAELEKKMWKGIDEKGVNYRP